MKYLGGKHGIGKEIASFITSKYGPGPSTANGYLEPFCGSLGVFKHMTDKNYKKYIASDIQPDLIEMWQKIQNGTLKLPKDIDETKWKSLKNSKSPNALKAVAGFGLSFGGDFFIGYAQKYVSTSGRNFYGEFKRSITKIKPTITKPIVKFCNKSYKVLKPVNMLIYCDPPYKDVVGYTGAGTFNHEEFWNIMRLWSKNNIVFISEEKAPNDFKCVWSNRKRRTLNKQVRDYRTEKLFMYSPPKKKHFFKC